MADDDYWVYENGYLQGPFKAHDLAARDSFHVTMMICRNGDHVWRPVHDVPEIAPVLADIAHTQIMQSGDYIADPSVPNLPSTMDDKKADPI